jgi:uncharacterized membrane protein YqiK
MLETLQSMSWLIPVVVGVVVLLLAIKFYRALFQLLGIVVISDDKIGLVTKKFAFKKGGELPTNRIIATNGEAGMQAATLAPGIHFGYWVWKFEITMIPFTIIPAGKIGLVSAKDGAVPPNGRLLGRKVECDDFQDAIKFLNAGGHKGKQATYLVAGSYRINTNVFSVNVVDQFEVPANKVGIVTTLDGEALAEGEIAAKSITGHNKYQDFDIFLENDGRRGLQEEVILQGRYNLNPWAVEVSLDEMSIVPIGYVGVVVSYVGDNSLDVSGEDFTHGNIVSRGGKGVWNEPLSPGKYPLNKKICVLEVVPTTNIVLNWANSRNESHELDKGLSTIKLRSKDGFTFSLDVSQIIHVSANDAPKVIARFGTIKNLVSQCLEPTISNYFRNSGQNASVLDFLTNRKEQQDKAKSYIGEVLDEYNIAGVDTLIGDINVPEELMRPISERKIAEELEATYITQSNAELKRQELEETKSNANLRPLLVQAQVNIDIAKREAESTIARAEGEATAAVKKADGESKAKVVLANAIATEIKAVGLAEAEAIKAIGEANAKSYKAGVDAMGEESYKQLQVWKAISEGKVVITPEVSVSGANGGTSVDALLAMTLKGANKDRKSENPSMLNS